jgi:hypothetical protein
MASPSVTYSFTNGTTADATQVNQNFTDLINGITDGTKDLSISALTCAGTATLNGAVNLGNASADDISVNGSVATAIVPKTTATYALGSSSIGWSYLYLGGSTYVVGLLASGSTTASYNLTLPTATGAAGTGMITNGSGVLSWKPLAVDTSAKAADYVITDGDGLRTILVTTAATDRDITLPTASDNTHRIITVKKVDSDAGIVTLKSDAAGETIDGVSGTTGIPMYSQYDFITVQCDGSDWHIIEKGIQNRWQRRNLTSNVTSDGSVAALAFSNLVVGNIYELSGQIQMSINVGSADITAQALVTHNSATIQKCTLQNRQTSSSVGDTGVSALSVKFVAADTTLTIVGANLSANSFIGGGTNGETYAILTEVQNNASETTDFTP